MNLPTYLFAIRRLRAAQRGAVVLFATSNVIWYALGVVVLGTGVAILAHPKDTQAQAQLACGNFTDAENLGNFTNGFAFPNGSLIEVDPQSSTIGRISTITVASGVQKGENNPSSVAVFKESFTLSFTGSVSNKVQADLENKLTNSEQLELTNFHQETVTNIEADLNRDPAFVRSVIRRIRNDPTRKYLIVSSVTIIGDDAGHLGTVAFQFLNHEGAQGSVVVQNIDKIDFTINYDCTAQIKDTLRNSAVFFGPRLIQIDASGKSLVTVNNNIDLSKYTYSNGFEVL